MAVTLEELKTRLAERLDESSLLEVLDINAEEIVERFEDKINDRFDKLSGELFDEEDSED